MITLDFTAILGIGGRRPLLETPPDDGHDGHDLCWSPRAKPCQIMGRSGKYHCTPSAKNEDSVVYIWNESSSWVGPYVNNALSKGIRLIWESV